MVRAKDGRATNVDAQRMVVHGKEGYVEFLADGETVGTATLANVEVVAEAGLAERLKQKDNDATG